MVNNERALAGNLVNKALTTIYHFMFAVRYQ